MDDNLHEKIGFITTTLENPYEPRLLYEGNKTAMAVLQLHVDMTKDNIELCRQQNYTLGFPVNDRIIFPVEEKHQIFQVTHTASRYTDVVMRLYVTPILTAKKLTQDDLSSLILQDYHRADKYMVNSRPSGDTLARLEMFQQMLDGANFKNVWMPQCVFMDCSLRDVNFMGANLRESVFINCDLTGADFAMANTASTSLFGCIIGDVQSREFARTHVVDRKFPGWNYTTDVTGNRFSVQDAP